MAGIEIYGAKVDAKGKRSIEMMGGWVPYSALVGPRKTAVDKVLASKFTPTQAAKWAAGEKLVATFLESDVEWEVPAKEGEVPPTKGESGGEGSDESDADSNGNGEGDGQDDAEAPTSDDEDDRPVMHSEFDPWAQTVGKKVKNLENEVVVAVSNVERIAAEARETADRLENVNKDVTLLLDASASVSRKLDLMDKRIKESASNGNGGSGGVTVRVEVSTPKSVEVGEGVFHHNFPKLVKLIASGQHTYLPGPPGTGKSHAAKQAADLLGWQFASLSLGPTTPESRLMGGMDANGRFHEPPFVAAARFAQDNPESGAAFCLDEMDNGHPGIIATLNSAMANGFFQAPNGDLIQFGRNFVVIGAANTFGTGPTAEFSGRNRLDAATLDRFAYLPWPTDLGMENVLVNSILSETPTLADDWLDVWHSARKNVETHGLKVFVSMRGAINGARLLQQGFDIFDAYEMMLGSKLPADQAAKVSPF